MIAGLNFYADLDTQEFWIVRAEKTIAYGKFEINKNKFDYKVFNADFLVDEFFNYVTNQIDNLRREVR